MCDSYRPLWRVAPVVVASLLGSGTLAAQTDYYNTDRGRPVEIEDAYATERHAFELKIAPIRLERGRGPAYTWRAEPEIAYGLLPRTHVEIGVPLVSADAPGGTTRGLAGIDLSLLHTLNVETETWPALGLRADVLAPIGSLAPDRAYASITGLMTRTFRRLRVHANGQYTFGSAQGPLPASAAEVSRWLAGVAADRAVPLESFLVTAELFARGATDPAEDVELNAGAGIRYQWSPTLALDAGVGRRLTGDNPAWYITVGSAYAFALASFIPNAWR